MGWRGRGQAGQWSGRGPCSNLPPWERPGWLYGRGTCWYMYGPHQTMPPIKPEDEAALLAEQKTMIEEQLKATQERLKKVQDRLNELNK
jgi:hypothetical protein